MTTTRSLEMLHIDLFGPITYISFGGNKYSLVIIDDYSRFTCVFFLQDKSEIHEVLKKLLKKAQNDFDAKVKKNPSGLSEHMRMGSVCTSHHILTIRTGSWDFIKSSTQNKAVHT
jgi:hypothetical protein